MPRILLVDDDPSVREILREFLLEADYEVVSAVDGLDGLRAFAEHGADLVISDISMPRMTGVAMLEHIHARDRDIPSILITGYPRDGTIPTEASGMLALLPKPFAASLLLDVVASMLRTAEQRRRSVCPSV